MPCTRLATTAVLVFTFGLGGCSPDRPLNDLPLTGDPLPCQMDGGPTVAQVTLVSCILPTLSGGGPRLFVGVQNVSGDPIVLAVRFDFSGMLTVFKRVDGQLRQIPLAWDEPVPVSRDRVTHTLARHGVLGQVLDMSCDVRDFGPMLECATLADWVPGEYQLVVELPEVDVCENVECSRVRTLGTLKSAPLTFSIRR